MDKYKKKINLPSYQIVKKPLTVEEVHAESCKLPEHDGRLNKISEEFQKGLAFVKRFPRSVTIYGSARFGDDHPLYQKAYILAKRISQELGFSVVTGGGPGIMEAANKGAYDAGGDSLGLNIELPSEQRTNPYVKESVEFYYFFSRKVALSFSANAYIFFPGGFGTIDEFSEILELVQTKKIPQVPLILVDSQFWKPLDMYFKNTLLMDYKTINTGDTELYKITDNDDEVLTIVKNAPPKNTIALK
jgi:uncharacterized protein (TIGR00730 family)